MAEAEADDMPETQGARTGMDTRSFAALSDAVNAEPGEQDEDESATESGSAASGEDLADGSTQEGAGEGEAVQKRLGPSVVVRSLRWLIRWHPLLFLGCALMLAAYAWYVYPEPEARKIPPAESFYYDGLDRLYRVINPDLLLIAASPADEALAARNAFLNLFVFHRENLRQYPSFINPNLLLAEANRMLAEFNPAMANTYWTDAANAYNDAAVWEDREDEPARFAIYLDSNFLGGKGTAAGNVAEAVNPDNEEVVLRRSRRRDYISYRRAEADVSLGHPDLARPLLEELRQKEDARRREELRLSAQEDPYAADVARHTFELGPDEYRQLDLLLAKTYDGLGLLERAKSWYLRYLASSPAGRNHAFVVERLAVISMGDGEVYRKSNPERSERDFQAAADYYRDLLASPSATRDQHDNAVLGLAMANSRLAGLVPAGEMAGVDELGAVGRSVRHWLEEFSGQPLPRRTLAIPRALGETLSRPELLLPSSKVLPGVAAGSLSAMAGGKLITPYERRRLYLTEALDNYDRIATIRRGTPAGDRAAIMAAWESWSLGHKADTESRLEKMLDPLSAPELILAARLGLATVALDWGDLRQAHMLMLGGYTHPLPLWFTQQDADWRKIAVRLGTSANREQPGAWRRVWESLSQEGREIAGYAASGRRLDDNFVNRFLRALNTMLRREDFYVAEDFPTQNRNFYLRYILSRDPELLTPEDVVWRNRMLLEEAWPYDLSQRSVKDNVGFEPFPPGRDIVPDGMIDPERVRKLLTDLAGAWSARAAASGEWPEKYRMYRESNAAYQAALDQYQAEPGEVLYELAHNYEALAELRELQGRHLDALSLTATAARAYLDVSLKARGSTREMDSLLAAGDAFFRSGLLERTVESQKRFLERFGYSSQPGTDGAMAVVRAENLLGRAFWFLGATEEALGSFRRNIPRRTPDRYKSIYYIGRVLLDEGQALGSDDLLGTDANSLPPLDRNGDPVIASALQAFNFLRQSPGINPTARAWRWATFDLAKLRYIFADRARRAWESAPERAGEQEKTRPWLHLYDAARINLTEALERYPLRRNGGIGLSVQVEPEDYADTMAARFESEYLLAQTLLVLADAREDDSLYSLARAHLENMCDRQRYANALFDRSLDRFQLNAAIIREEVEGGNWDRNTPLPRTRLGDDEGPTHSPQRQLDMLRNSMLLLGEQYFLAGERARDRQLLASTAAVPGQTAANDVSSGYYQDSYRVWQDVYDRFGLADGPQSMVKMGDNLARLGFPDDAANHYRMGVNMAELLPADTRADGVLNIGPAFWGTLARQRLRDMADGYTVP